MELIFLGLLLCTLLLFFLRFGMTTALIKRKRTPAKREINEEKYTIVQPILSGDPRLAEDLKANLEQTTTMPFIWLIDKSDTVAQQIVTDILNIPSYSARITCLYFDDVPENVNPKSYKLMQGMSKLATEYTIILDDDTVIDFQTFSEATRYEELKKEVVVTGIPYNHGQKERWSRLIAAFVNSNSIVSYFTMAQLNETYTINGMFYIVKTEVLKKYQVFESIQEYLCDDLAVAECLRKRGVQLIQSTISCNVRTTVVDSKSYLRLMKRWLLFATIYMKRYFSYKLFLFVILPNSLPFVLFVFSCWLSPYLMVCVVGLNGIKSLVMRNYRQKIFGIHENVVDSFYETLCDFLLPLLYSYAVITAPVIVWRNKKIRITDGKITYE